MALFPDASEYFPPLIMSLSLFEIIYGGLTTCRQVDLKRLIAYSSVAYMGLVTDHTDSSVAMMMSVVAIVVVVFMLISVVAIVVGVVNSPEENKFGNYLKLK